MADLKTTYKDDLLDTSVNEKRKYNMIQNADGTVSFEDVTTYSQIGDSFGAVDINATNEKVNELNSNFIKCINYKIDENNTIQEQLTANAGTTLNYVATEKCFISYYTYGNDKGAKVQINGFSYGIAHSPTGATVALNGITRMLDIGDEFTINATIHSCGYTVYGIKEYS